MDFSAWEPVYEAILSDFGYSRVEDEQARDLFVDLLGDGGTGDPDELGLAGRTVAIVGAADSLRDELDTVRRADAVLAASTAGDVLLEAGIEIDCLVTDLDKHPETVVSVNHSGTPVAVHAHGDNVSLLRSVVPRLDASLVIPTTQAAPAGPVRNDGGFTDGDRAAFLAVVSGAGRLVFPGWDFEDPTVDAEKRHKLRWAEWLLYWLESQSGRHFGVLDGRRGALRVAVHPETPPDTFSGGE